MLSLERQSRKYLLRAHARRELTLIAAACAMLPDADSIGFRLGIHYGDLWGHRGFTHSLLFAGVVAVGVMAALWNKTKAGEILQTLVCIFVATISHGVLDAFTNGGMGVAFLSPFDKTRYFFPLTPIKVSPLSAKAFLTQRGVSVLASEMAWVWCPAIVMTIAARWARCRETNDITHRT